MRFFVQSIVVFIFFIWAIWFAAAGFLASDDASYSLAAVGWLQEFPFVGERHWELRQMIVLPLTGIYSLFGTSETTLVSVSTIYFILLVAMAAWCLFRNYSSTASMMFIFLAAVSPGFVALAGTANVDVVEAFYILSSLFLFRAAVTAKNVNALIFLSGVLAGFAFLSRATAIALIICYGLFFLLGWYHDRKRYVPLALGAFLIYSIDTFYYFVQTGDWFYRFHTVVATHVDAVESNTASVHGARGTLPATGNLLEGTIYEPVMAILVSNEFGLLFFVALFVYVLVRRFPGERDKSYDWLGIYFIVALVHFIVVGYVMGLRPLPRYFSYSFLPPLLFLAVVLPKLWLGVPRMKVVAAASVITLFVSGLVLIDLTDREPLRVSKALIKTTEQYAGKSVSALPKACFRANVLLSLSNPAQKTRIKCAPIQDADIILYQWGIYADELSSASESGLIFEGFTIVKIIRSKTTVTGQFVRGIQLHKIISLPDRLYRYQPPIYVLVRNDNQKN